MDCGLICDMDLVIRGTYHERIHTLLTSLVNVKKVAYFLNVLNTVLRLRVLPIQLNRITEYVYKDVNGLVK